MRTNIQGPNLVPCHIPDGTLFHSKSSPDGICSDMFLSSLLVVRQCMCVLVYVHVQNIAIQKGDKRGLVNEYAIVLIFEIVLILRPSLAGA